MIESFPLVGENCCCTTLTMAITIPKAVKKAKSSGKKKKKSLRNEISQIMTTEKYMNINTP